ncbi:MAG TPA: DUF2267 domain-containing protein [Afifellaceae bacterium]|jgi:hypothetical protein|nr:DUF2267 domain-containing protein [Afifellaceae bacterium]
MDELIGQIASSVGIDEATAKQAVTIIVSFLNSEGPSDKVQQLVSAIPGMEDYISADTGSGGLAGMMGGVMAVAGQLQGLGLGMGEIQGVTQQTVAYAKEKGGEDLVNEIVGSIPGLGQFV